MAAWTKDEGILFLVVFLVAAYSTTRSGARPLGATPIAKPSDIFKVRARALSLGFFGQGISTMLNWTRRSDKAWIRTQTNSPREVAAMSFGWYHPVRPLPCSYLALRLKPRTAGRTAFAGSIPLVMLAGYIGIFLITPFDLVWQLQTSLYRLLAQLWPESFLLAAFVILNAPESIAARHIPEPEQGTQEDDGAECVTRPRPKCTQSIAHSGEPQKPRGRFRPGPVCVAAVFGVGHAMERA